MVYCELKEKRENSAVYAYGSSISDMNGEIQFYSDGRNPLIIKHPTVEVMKFELIGLFGKYCRQMLKGNFPVKLSYVI